MTMTKKLLRAGGVTLTYALLALMMLHQPVFNLATHLPGDRVTDYYFFHWNYWWMRHAFSEGLPLYETAYVMAPHVNNLAYHTLAEFWYPLWALLEPAFGTITAMTAIFATGITLTGTLFYALLRREGVTAGLAFVGGAILALAPVMIRSIYWTNVNLIGWFWIPLLVLLWGQLVKATPRYRLLWTLGLGVALWGMLLTSTQLPIFAAFIIVPYGLLTLWQAPNWRERAALAALVIVAAAFATALFWLAGPLDYLLRYDSSGLIGTPAENASAIIFPWGYLWNDGVTVAVGTMLLPLLAVALWLNWRTRHIQRNPRRWFWLTLVPLPLVLSAGAYITLGEAEIPMPYLWMHELLGGMFRYPRRLAAVFTLPAVIFIMLTLTPMLKGRKIARWAVPTGLLLLCLWDVRLFDSLPIQPQPRPYTFYEVMGTEAYDYVVVEVPTAAASGEGIVGESAEVALQYYGIVHGKRMVNGHISRVDLSHFWPLRTEDPLLSWLGQRRWLEPDLAQSRLTEIIADYPVGYFVIHTDLIGQNTPTVQEIVGYFNSLPDLLCLVFVEGDAIVFRTTWHPDGCPPRTPPQNAEGHYRVDLGQPEDYHYTGWGWHWPEEIITGLDVRWTGAADGESAWLYVELPPDDYTLHFNAQAFQHARALTVFANGVSLGTVTVPESHLADFTLNLPASVFEDTGRLALQWVHDPATPTGDGENDRQLALMIDRLWFAPVLLGD